MVCVAQTVSGPAIIGAGMVSAVEVTVTVESHPSGLVSVTEMEPDPELFHKTEMEVLLVVPTIIPPVTFHAYVFPATGEVTPKVVVEVVQLIKEPVITGTG